MTAYEIISSIVLTVSALLFISGIGKAFKSNMHDLQEKRDREHEMHVQKGKKLHTSSRSKVMR